MHGLDGVSTLLGRVAAITEQMVCSQWRAVQNRLKAVVGPRIALQFEYAHTVLTDEVVLVDTFEPLIVVEDVVQSLIARGGAL